MMFITNGLTGLCSLVLCQLDYIDGTDIKLKR